MRCFHFPQTTVFDRRRFDSARIESLEEIPPMKPNGSKRTTTASLKSFNREMIGCNVNNFGTGGGQKAVNLSYQWSSTNSWYVGNVAWVEQGGHRTVKGMNINPIPASLETLNAFTLKGKGPLHWAFLSLAIFIPLLMLFAAISCCRTRIPKRKWLWMIFVVMGFWQLSLNWTSGELSVSEVPYRGALA